MAFFRSAFISLFILVPLTAQATNHQEGILLIQGGVERTLSLSDLRDSADVATELYEPFRRDQIEIRGIRFADFVRQNFEGTPSAIELQAHDGYTIKITDWQDRNWILMTHEGERPLTLRTHGPVRLVQEDLRDRNPEILRDFIDWVWMIQRIEAKP
ncbi:MAG: hypothetical protein LAT65_01810 [Saccharospirillum sp.]|nr:hypothetical protein [Saccharospirillum sp.]